MQGHVGCIITSDYIAEWDLAVGSLRYTWLAELNLQPKGYIYPQQRPGGQAVNSTAKTFAQPG